jgi:hypothetical protein
MIRRHTTYGGMALGGLVLLFLAAAPVAAGPLPVQMLGYNADIITDKNPPRFAQSFNGQGHAWFEAGAVDDFGVAHSDGLPAGTTFTSNYVNPNTGDRSIFLIQPAVFENALLLKQGDTLTLTFARPISYSSLAILASSANGGGTGTFAITFVSGNTYADIYHAYDWADNGTHPDAAITGLGRSKIGNDGTAFGYNHDADYALYETDFAIPRTENVRSITFFDTAFDETTGQHADFTAIFAISGVTARSNPEPSTWVLASLGIFSLLSYAWRRRQRIA